MRIESRGGLSSVEAENSGERLGLLWSQYGFPGEAPRAGTPVEQRLQGKCRAYADKVVKDAIDPKRSLTEGSDRLRKDLHNELAIMIFGKQRDSLDPQSIENVTDFACELTHDGKLEDIAEEYRASAV